MLTRMRLDPARTDLLSGFFESYLRLNAEEETELNKELETISAKGEMTVEQLHSSWYKKGRAEGQVKATQSAIVEYMEARFGVPAAQVSRSLEQTTDIERLRSLRRALFGANNQEEALKQIATAQGGDS